MLENEFVLIKRRLGNLLSIDLDCYKSPQMQRRLDGYLGRVRASSWTELLHRLENDPQAIRQLRDFITINVSSFFRDRKKWEELRDFILPQITCPGRALRAWSAACSHGAEAFSLAMLFQETPTVFRYQITGTDVDRSILLKARAGGPYNADDIRETPADLIKRYFRQDAAGYWIQPKLLAHVNFVEQDLLRATAVAEFDLVVCRNVLIYFTQTAKDQVISNLARALVPGGFLFIGATESISPLRSFGLERAGFSFYRRIGA